MEGIYVNRSHSNANRSIYIEESSKNHVLNRSGIKDISIIKNKKYIIYILITIIIIISIILLLVIINLFGVLSFHKNIKSYKNNYRLSKNTQINILEYYNVYININNENETVLEYAINEIENRYNDRVLNIITKIRCKQSNKYKESHMLDICKRKNKINLFYRIQKCFEMIEQIHKATIIFSKMNINLIYNEEKSNIIISCNDQQFREREFGYTNFINNTYYIFLNQKLLNNTDVTQSVVHGLGHLFMGNHIEDDKSFMIPWQRNLKNDYKFNKIDVIKINKFKRKIKQC